MSGKDVTVKEDENLASGKTPTHVAIIMDGNGRWAQKRGLPRNEGHRQGVENVRRIVRCAGESGIHYLTVYAFSVENWNRPEEEVGLLMELLEHFLASQVEELHKNNIRLKVIGRIGELPGRVQRILQETVQATAHYNNWTFVLALNYGARTEIVDAVKAYARAQIEGRVDPDTLDWKEFSRYLYTHDIPDPDLIIRTSGESRLSNFLLLQGAYSEFYFTPKFWPEFGPEDFYDAIECYKQRERRFGKTGEQVRRSHSEPILNR